MSTRHDHCSSELTPLGAAAIERHRLAVELVAEINISTPSCGPPEQRITTAVAASGTTLTDIYGVGPIVAAMLIGYTGDITRFANRDRYAAYTGTAPVEFSSGGRSPTGCHGAATDDSTTPCTSPPSPSSANATATAARYYERKLAEGKTHGKRSGR